MSERLIIRTTGQTGPGVTSSALEDLFGVTAGTPGGTDDTALFTAAEAALPAAGGLITLSGGEYALPSGYSFSKRVRLVGQGMGDPYNAAGATFPAHTAQRGLTSILCSSATAAALTFTVDGSSMSDLVVVNTAGSTPSAGAGVAVTLANLFTLDRVGVLGFYDCVDINNGGIYSVRGCWIANPVRYGVRLRNDAQPDEGDGFIGDGTAIYATTRDAFAAINWESGGGLKVSGVKINGNTPSGSFFISGIRFNTKTGVSTSVAAIVGCSIENVGAGVNFERQSGNGTFATVAIVGNEIGAGAGTSYAVLCQSDGFSQIEIAHNVIRDYTFGIIATAGSGINVGPNTLTNTGYGGAVTVSGTATDVVVAPQHVYESDLLVTDGTAAATPAQITYDYTYPLGTITGSATTLWRCAVPNNNAGTIDFDVSGNAVGVGAFTIRGTRSYTKATGGVTVATVGTDVEVGGTSGIAVTFDTAAVSGEVQIKVATAGAASDIDGVAHMNVRGRLSSLTRGA